MSINNLTPRLIAFYLPQFHPIPENDEWWGKGFTEWTNTAKAKPLFKGHYQPNVPADLGFYDLRLPETRAAQAVMAKKYGIEGFCYYHYWFAGRRLLERPFDEVLNSGQPDFPFCLCWANEDWTGIWHGAPNRMLMKQTYPGMEDHKQHFDYLIRAFADPRYIKVEGKPVFVVYRPHDLPDVKAVTDLWRKMAVAAGFPDLYLIAHHCELDWDPPSLIGFDSVLLVRMAPKREYMEKWATWRTPIWKLRLKIAAWRRLPTIHQYEHVIDNMVPNVLETREAIPCVIPNWDNTPRSGRNGLTLQGSTPDLFRIQFRKALHFASRSPIGQRFVFVKSWNEWAEGNYLEPDLRFGHGYLKVIREELDRLSDATNSIDKVIVE